MNETWKRRILPVAIVAASIAVARILVALGPTTEPASAELTPQPVQTMVVKTQTHRRTVHGTGVVQPKQQIEFIPEVAGRVVWVSDKLRPGGQFERGEAIARLDARDYEVALAAEQTRQRQADLELAVEQQRSASAAREWQLLDNDGPPSELTLRRPQLALATAQAASAAAAVERAQRNVDRTTLRAPFNAVVLSERIDVGQTVGAASVATLAGTDVARVAISISETAAAQFASPSDNDTRQASVTQRHSDGSTTYPARFVGIAGQLDPVTRTATALLDVDTPLAPAGGQPPLLTGAFVEAHIDGDAVDGLIAVPQRAVVDGSRVWTVVDDRLQRQALDVVFSDAAAVYVREGLAPGAVVVVSRLADPIDGQLVVVEVSDDDG